MNGPVNQRTSDPDTFDVRASLRTIVDAVRHGRMLVIGTCLLTLLILTAYVVIWPPVYTASATLMVERDVDPIRDSFYVGWNVFRKDDARTEIELMTAGPILKEVVEKEGLTYDDVYHPFTSHLSYLWGNSTAGKTYRGIKRAILGGDPGAPPDADLEMARTIVDMHAGISVSPVAESNIGRMEVKGPNRKVKDIANTLVDTYLQRRTERHYAEAERSHEILADQVKEAAADLAVFERRRLAFSTENNLAFDFQKEAIELTTLTDLEKGILDTRSRAASLRASLREIERQLASEPELRTTATIYEINALREAAKMKRLDLEGVLIGLEGRYREDSPEILELRRDLEQVDAVIANAAETVEKGTTESLNPSYQELRSRQGAILAELEGLTASLSVSEQSATVLRRRLEQVPALQSRLRSLDRDYALAQEKYQQLLAKEAQAAVSVAVTKATMPSMRVVEYAVTPAKPSAPKIKILYPAALVVGLLLGICAAVLKSYLDGRVRREHIETGSDLPVYVTLGVASHGTALHVVPRESATNSQS